MTPLPVLVLAGSREGALDPLARYGKVTHKALLPIQGVPMVERVIKALENTPQIGPIWVSIEDPECLQAYADRVHLLPAASTPSASVSQALELIGAPCLVTTADHALLRKEWIEEFLSQSAQSGADLTAAVASRQTVERDVPATKRTYIPLSDRQLSGCNLFWLGTPRAGAVVKLWEKLQQERKHPFRMAWLLGPGTLVKALLRRLGTRDVEERIQALTGARVALIEMGNGQAAVDVDKLEDYHLVERLLDPQPASQVP
ncbi:nucleotidyltransferase family protein [Oecophyllibacter saccharovorans]|uniref:MobA-like NTP transferase domain-containing protein n=1 Tax=Oecophyllibacter saccharovorans TaxID=2558360 RepID=A0A506UQQ3_9PROT|nr:nucleotidyltransferase family protein [Oecophyllibacter saccharovorans]TPW35670.1 hypothetical protein E3202_01510 [Oecophyllibacter saccharovorans]